MHALAVEVPVGRVTAVTWVSGSGKSTLVLEGLVPALTAAAAGEALPAHVTTLDAPGLGRVNLVDATPIGVNVRSTVATYSGVLDDLRREYAKTAAATAAGLKAGAFSYNTGSLRGQLGSTWKKIAKLSLPNRWTKQEPELAVTIERARHEEAASKALAKAGWQRAVEREMVSV